MWLTARVHCLLGEFNRASSVKGKGCISTTQVRELSQMEAECEERWEIFLE